MAKFDSGKWEIKADLSEAGQSWTYLVSDASVSGTETFVLKRLKNPARLHRFAAEIRALQELSHPGIVKLVDFNLDSERPWFVQEYCPGGDLDNYVKARSPLPPQDALNLFGEILVALSYAHSNSMFHRDIKPANIFLRAESGPPVLGDFGLCWPTETEQRLTLTDEAVGSFKYMAPEVRDGRVTEPSWHQDIYSAGKVLYFMLSGGRVFDREVHRAGEWDLSPILGDAVAAHINPLLDLMIAYEPADRLSAKDLIHRVEKAAKLIEGSFAPLDPSAPSPCKYCGLGVYRPLINSDGQLQSFFGFLPSAVSDVRRAWRAMACNRCGNIQFFTMSTLPEAWWPEKK